MVRPTVVIVIINTRMKAVCYKAGLTTRVGCLKLKAFDQGNCNIGCHKHITFDHKLSMKTMASSDPIDY